MKTKTNWYKISTGLPQDTKLAVVAKRTGFRRGEVLAVWVALLDQASAAAPRGNVNHIDAEEIAAALECDTAAIGSVIAAMRERSLILPDGMIFNWEKHQPVSTPRTRAYRARQRNLRVPLESDETRRARLTQEMNGKRQVQA